jgi:hypothetical protein
MFFFMAKVSQMKLLDEDKIRDLIEEEEIRKRLYYLNKLLKNYE